MQLNKAKGKGGAAVHNEIKLENEYKEYMLYLYELASVKYGDCSELDSLIQETLIALLVKQRSGDSVEHKKGFLATVLKNKYNEWLRRKYKNRIVSFESIDYCTESSDLEKIEDAEAKEEEYSAVRREIGRLISIYREVTVRHYIGGESIEEIASSLGISVGTVKTRLSSARKQIKEGITKMEKYSEISYKPKYLSIAIWGNSGLNGEPFSAIRGEIEQNILILAYESPLSIRNISESIGIPTAYIEPIVERLISAELMGKTSGGLVYTRIFIVGYESSFGDISAQEQLAKRHAKQIWMSANKQLTPIFETDRFKNMSEKQKATLCLFAIDSALQSVVSECSMSKYAPALPPERKNGGRWYAYGTACENNSRRNIKYESSGPVSVSCFSESDNSFICRLQDKQSLFGSAHWAYNGFKYKLSLQAIARFYASLVPECSIAPNDNRVYDLVPDFEKLHIVKTDKNGKVLLDIPYLPEEITQSLFYPAITRMYKEIIEFVRADLERLCNANKRRVPKHVDGSGHCETQWLLRAYPLAVMEEIVNRGLMPYNVEIGKTPIIFLSYKGD